MAGFQFDFQQDGIRLNRRISDTLDSDDSFHSASGEMLWVSALRTNADLTEKSYAPIRKNFILIVAIKLQEEWQH